MADPTDKNKRPHDRSGMPSLKANVYDRLTDSQRETSTSRPVTYETNTVAFQKQLKGTGITREGDLHPQVAPPTSEMVTGGRQCAPRTTITPTKTYSANL